MSFSLESKSWFQEFTALVFSTYQSPITKAADNSLQQMQESVHQGLFTRGFDKGFMQMTTDLGEGLSDAETLVLSKLRYQLEMIQDMAASYGKALSSEQFQLAANAVLSACSDQEELAENCSTLWRQRETGEQVDAETSTESVMQDLNTSFKTRFQKLSKLSTSMNLGLAYFDILEAGLHSISLFSDDRLVKSERDRVRFQVGQDRSHFMEATIALAWSNGLLDTEERNLIKKQIETLAFEKKEKRRLINLLITPSTPKEFSKGFSSSHTKQFVLKQLMLASFIDGSQDQKEVDFLQATATEFGISQDDFLAYLEQSKSVIQELQ